MTKLWERLKAVFGNRDKKAANRKAKGARKAPKAANKAETKVAPKAKAKEKAEKVVKSKPEEKAAKEKAKATKGGKSAVPPDARLLALATWAAGQTGDSRLVEIVGRRLAALRRHERTLGAYAGVCRAYADLIENMDPRGAVAALKRGWWDWAVSAGYGGDFTPPRSLRGRVMEGGGEED